MRGDEFELAAFKGQGLTFRRWNQQMRQPILLATPRMLVSVSPQDEFLHQRTPLDTLGFDEPESQLPPELNGGASKRPTEASDAHRLRVLATAAPCSWRSARRPRRATIYVSNEKGNSITVVDGDKLEVVKHGPGRQAAARHHAQPGRQVPLHLRVATTTRSRSWTPRRLEIVGDAAVRARPRADRALARRQRRSTSPTRTTTWSP